MRLGKTNLVLECKKGPVATAGTGKAVRLMSLAVREVLHSGIKEIEALKKKPHQTN